MIWSTANITQLKRVKELLNFAAKVAIGGASKFDHATQQITMVPQKVIYEQCLTSFKIKNNRIRSWLFCFPQVRNMNSTNTRQQNLLHIPRTKTDTGFRSLTLRGPKLWNNLTSNAKDHSLHVLKAELKTSYYTNISP